MHRRTRISWKIRNYAMPPFTVTTPIPGAAWGALVAGVDFSSPVAFEVIESLRQELHRHAL